MLYFPLACKTLPISGTADPHLTPAESNVGMSRVALACRTCLNSQARQKWRLQLTAMHEHLLIEGVVHEAHLSTAR